MFGVIIDHYSLLTLIHMVANPFKDLIESLMSFVSWLYIPHFMFPHFWFSFIVTNKTSKCSRCPNTTVNDFEFSSLSCLQNFELNSMNFNIGGYDSLTGIIALWWCLSQEQVPCTPLCMTSKLCWGELFTVLIYLASDPYLTIGEQQFIYICQCNRLIVLSACFLSH